MANEGNRVYVKTATTGTGTITLGAAVSSAFCTFAEAGIANATVVHSYCIEDGGDFEIGSGTYTSAGTTLSRTTVTLSKIAGVSGTTKLTLSGNATVRVIAASEDIVTTTGSNTLAGDLIINKTTPQLVLNKQTASEHMAISGNNNSLSRWYMSLGNTTAETGSNAGSDFAIYRYTDAGAFIQDALTIFRSNGSANFNAPTVSITYTGSGGANLALYGDGGTTPNKYIRAQAGALEFINSAYSAVPMTMTDAGDLTWTGGAWTAYTPTLAPTAGAYTSASASGRYKLLGKTVVVSVSITITTVGTGTTPTFTLPVSPQAISSVVFHGTEQSITGKVATGRNSGAGTIITTYYDGTNPAASGTSFKLFGTYEAA